ncbi:classical arabinogalactan protein 25-like [Phalaenopsis equestris]|uniref:classical arabinogalactan protein 25-like n=1 Tax=Phalaenopsis equestris TaxID=78828 RepID=UPI0009E43C45|nr:classical arabinogalactan protein 25-like [Phalaenopsis equestris]
MATTSAMFILFLLPHLTAKATPPSTTSFISASPSILPSIEPSLPPDIMPVLPSPQTGYSPDGLLPTIPSNLSPPNPDSLDPNSAFAPFGPSDSANATPSAASPPPALSCFLLGLASMWWLEFSCK